jgi:TP901 family phage tail tape measure protein
VSAEAYNFGLAVQLADEVSKPARRARKALGELQVQMLELAGMSSDPLEKVTRGVTQLNAILIDVRASAGSATQATTAMGNAVGALERRAGSAAQRLTFFQRTISAITAQFSASALIGRVHATVDAFKDMVKVGAAFDQQMAFAGTTMNATPKELALITAEAERLGKTTSFKAVEAAKGFVGLGQAGFNAAQSIKLMEPIMHLAGGQMISVEKATGLISQGLKTFSLNASQASRVADVFARAANASYQTAQDLGTALKYVGPVAAALGKSLEETAGALSVSADAALRGSMGGTGLRRILTTLITPSKKLDEGLKLIGLTMRDVNPQTQSLADVFEKLAPLANNTGAAMKLFGDRGGPAFLALARAQGEINGKWLKGAEYMRAMTKAMSEGNSAADIYRVMMDTVAGKMKLWEGAVEAVKIAIFGGFKNELKAFLTDSVVRLNALSNVIKNLAPVIRIAFLTFVSVFRIVGAHISGAVGMANSSLQVLSRTGPEHMKRIEDVVGPLMVAMTFFKIAAEDFAKGFLKGWSQGWAVFTRVMGVAFKVFDFILSKFLSLIGVSDRSASAAERFGQRVGLALSILVGVVLLKLAMLIPALVAKTFWAWGIAAVGAFKLVAAGIAWLYGIIWGVAVVGLKAALAAAGQAIVAFGAVLLASPITWYVAAFFALLAVGYLVVKFWDELKAAAVSAFTWIYDNIVKVGMVLLWFMGPVGVIVAGVIWAVGTIIKHWDTIKAAFTVAWEAMRLVFWTVVNWMRERWGDVTSHFSELWRNAVDGAKIAYQWLANQFAEITKPIRETFRSLIDWFVSSFGTIAKIAEKVFGWIRGSSKSVSAELRATATNLSDKADAARQKVTGQVSTQEEAKRMGAAWAATSGQVALHTYAGDRFTGAKKLSEADRLRQQIADPTIPIEKRREFQKRLGKLFADQQAVSRMNEAPGFNESLVDSQRALEADEAKARGLTPPAAGRGGPGKTSLEALNAKGSMASGSAAADRASSGTGAKDVHFHLSSGAIQITPQGAYDAEKLGRDLMPVFRRLMQDEIRRDGVA